MLLLTKNCFGGAYFVVLNKVLLSQEKNLVVWQSRKNLRGMGSGFFVGQTNYFLGHIKQFHQCRKFRNLKFYKIKKILTKVTHFKIKIQFASKLVW